MTHQPEATTAPLFVPDQDVDFFGMYREGCVWLRRAVWYRLKSLKPSRVGLSAQAVSYTGLFQGTRSTKARRRSVGTTIYYKNPGYRLQQGQDQTSQTVSSFPASKDAESNLSVISTVDNPQRGILLVLELVQSVA